MFQTTKEYQKGICIQNGGPKKILSGPEALCCLQLLCVCHCKAYRELHCGYLEIVDAHQKFILVLKILPVELE